jgi:hypothetical protein
MKKFTTAVFAAFIALALSMPAWSQDTGKTAPATNSKDSGKDKDKGKGKDKSKTAKKSKGKDKDKGTQDKPATK